MWSLSIMTFQLYEDHKQWQNRTSRTVFVSHKISTKSHIADLLGLGSLFAVFIVENCHIIFLYLIHSSKLPQKQNRPLKGSSTESSYHEFEAKLYDTRQHAAEITFFVCQKHQCVLCISQQHVYHTSSSGVTMNKTSMGVSA